MAVYQADRELLGIQVRSLRDQTLANWRCYVGIDGPDPALRAVVKGLVAGDARFEVVEYNERVGFYRNFERLLSAVPEGTPWVALCDQDDRWYPEKVDTLVPLLERAVAAVGRARIVDRGGRVVGTSPTRRVQSALSLFVDNQVTGSLAVFRTDVVRAALPFPEPTGVSFHDHWLAVCAHAVGEIAFDPKIVQDYVQHGGNVIGEERRWRPAERLAVLYERAGSVRPREVIRVLSEERWGWRVAMARALGETRRGIGTTKERGDVEMVVRGRLTWALAARITRAALSRNVRAGRALALLVGAFFWRESRWGSHGGNR